VHPIAACNKAKNKKPSANFKPLETKMSPAGEYSTLNSKSAEDTLINDLAKNASASPDKAVILYVHGFNNRPEDAVRRVAELSVRAGFSGAPLVFTWPAYGTRGDGGVDAINGLVHYLYDLQSSNWSRDALYRLLLKLSENGDINRVYIVAHSMGSWLTMEAIRQAAVAGNSHVLNKIAAVDLLAADLDVDVFKKQLELINSVPLGLSSENIFGKRITVYSSTEDGALKWSQRLSFAPRLGKVVASPQTPAEKDMDSHLRWLGTRLIDTTGFVSDCDDTEGHYKAADERAVEDIRLTLGQKANSKIKVGQIQ
jgi:esterase/lipase superfamily enzyme